MKILIDLTSLADNFSGIERYAMSSALEMINDRQHQFVLLFKGDVHKAFLDTGDNVEKIVLPVRKKLWFHQITVPLSLLRIKADRYLFPAYPAPFLFFRKSAVSAIHDLGCWDCPTTNKKHMTLYFKILYRKAAMSRKKVFTCSEFSAGRIREILRVRQEDLTVAYCGLPEHLAAFVPDEKVMAAVAEKYRLPENYLLCLSTLEPRKNLKLLVAAFDRLRREGEIQADLVLAGRKGWMVDDLLSGYSQDTLEHIHFTGFVDDEDLPYIYHGAKMFVFPSLYEGFGIPPVEALSVGTPVVSSDAASLPEVLKDCAVYFKSNDQQSLMDAVCAMLSMEQSQREIMIARGATLSRSYSWKASAKKLMDMLTKE